MKSERFTTLIVCRNPDLIAAVSSELSSSQSVEWRFHAVADAKSIIGDQPVEICLFLIDRTHPLREEMSELRRVRQRLPQAVVIVVGDEKSGEVELDAWSSGADEFAPTSHLSAAAIERTVMRCVERRMTADKLRHRERWYRVAVAEGNVGLWRWDRPCNFFYLADHFQDMLSIAHDDLPSDLAQWIERIHPDDRHATLDAADAHFSGRSDRFVVEHRIRRGDDGYRWYLSSGCVAENDADRKQILGASTDISARKEAEFALQRAKRAAESAVRVKSEFLTNMSHELRTPLAAILGYSEIMEDHAVTSESLEAVDTIRRNGQHLLELIGDILEFSRIESGKLEVSAMPTPAYEFLKSTFESFRELADDKGLRFVVDVSDQIPEMIITDPVCVRQILWRLVTNAVKFTDAGEIGVAVRVADGNLELNVRDTGCGIPAEMLSSIYQPFRQADNSSTRRHDGAGLGLAICQKLSQMLGGDISVRSQAGAGSQFTVRLPIERTASDKRRQGKSKEEKLPAKRLSGRVLLAEDGPDNQRLYDLLLRTAGAKVTVVENGRQAMEVALEQAAVDGGGFDLILMDMQMPVMDGYEATRVLRLAGYRKPIVALTAHAMADDRAKCLDAGCNDYIAKPVERSRFIAICRSWIEEGRGLRNELNLSSNAAAND
ncbi:hybrid sensor histidine kinase/response regulator [Blastopirellula marina]|uniref:histidine kinase n=1 Tax=Blastopirellula marina DSM 3645 TaxID=314230 RepID=A3ZQR9_9BACT|nr:ATP-binding protein [Blastopirellula marina]EAQ81009.1 sensory transduction histidine kinase [Blastopirellula marina DSM 3645]